MLTVSIIIPSKNEAQDIRATIEACLRLEGPLKEVIVVDDSDDNTPEIVREYASQNVVLVHRALNRNGCCGARSEGVRIAGGDICAFVNADVRPSPDFLTKIIPHFEDGADFLVIGSRVLNFGNRWGIYVQARTNTYSVANQEWCEGFSFKRSAVLSLKQYPGDYPVPFCRDYILGISLRTAGYKRHFDDAIVVEHIVPDTLGAYWKSMSWRGTFLAPAVFYLRKRSIGYASTWTLLKAFYEFGQACTIVVPLRSAVRLRRLLKHGGSLFSLFVVDSVMHFAVGAGNMRGLYLLLRHLLFAPSAEVAPLRSRS